MGEMEKMKIFDNRCLHGIIENVDSQTKHSAIVEIKSFKPVFDVFQSVRRGITIRDEEVLADLSKSK